MARPATLNIAKLFSSYMSIICQTILIWLWKIVMESISVIIILFGQIITEFTQLKQINTTPIVHFSSYSYICAAHYVQGWDKNQLTLANIGPHVS